MSREIKFRVWDEIGKWMGNVTSFDFDEGTVFIETKHSDDENRFDMNNVPVVQYTGLKDKNGKEIYEGDILKTPSVSGKGDIITTIEWSEFSWKEKLIYSPIHQFYEYFDFSDETGVDSEVIGNIYENPELLEGIA